MRLRLKISLILLMVFILYGAINYGIQRFIILPGFQALENQEAIKNSKRVVQAIESEIHHLDSLCHDWAAWDDTYDFIKSKSMEYIEANLVITTFIDSSLNLLYFVDTNGKVTWGEIHDLETGGVIQLDDLPIDDLKKTHPLINFSFDDKPLSGVAISGIYLTDKGPMLIASRPVLNSNNEGPIRGAVIMGRFLGPSMVKTLMSQTEVVFQVYPAQPSSKPDKIKGILDRISDKSKFVIEKDGEDYLEVYTTISGINEEPAVLVGSKLERNITEKGNSIVRYAMYSMITAGAGVLVVLLLLLQWTVLAPIIKLTNHTLAVAETGDLSVRIAHESRDEIGTLAGEFDAMLQNLSDTRNRLLEQSYYSGLAEMASGTLHTVRNILASIIGQTNKIQVALNAAPLKNIERAVSELESGTVTLERKQALDRYLLLGSSQMVATVHKTSSLLGNIVGNVSQIESVIAEQDKFSHAERVIESLQISEILNKATKLVPYDFKNIAEIGIDPGLSELPAISAERVVLVQVMSNLLNNAVESIIKTENAPGKINVTGDIEIEADSEMAHIRFIDNGVGIESSMTEHIFKQGYSRKKINSSGFGLHWCGNVMSAMGGKIYATSGGPGKGACLHLLIPIA